MHWIWHLILGGIAGWLAGKVMRGEGYGVFVDIIVGLIGGWLGGKIGELIGFHLEGAPSVILLQLSWEPSSSFGSSGW